jgi:hypothetical protein
VIRRLVAEAGADGIVVARERDGRLGAVVPHAVAV